MASGGIGKDERRYEFRIFGAGAEAAFHRLAEASAHAPEQARQDIYFVAPGLVTSGLKLRDGRLDLKRLDGMSERFELWRPQAFAELPLEGAEIARRFLAPAGLPAFVLDGCDYDAEALIAAARADRRVAPIRVSKLRRQVTLGEDLAEHAALVIAGHGAETTFAAESRDPDRLAALVGRAGLSDRANVSYPRHLAGLAFGDAP